MRNRILFGVTTLYQLQRLFSVEWYERMVIFGELERIRKYTVKNNIKALAWKD